MSTNAQKVNYQDIDNSQGVSPAQLGVTGFEGILRRGPVNRPDILINSLSQFRKLYGASQTSDDFAFQCERVLAKGGQLRINGIRHYSSITDKSTLTALKPAVITIADAASGGQNLFTLTPKYPGADYNNLRVQITSPTNGLGTQGYFNLNLYILGDEKYSLEEYPNLRIIGKPSNVNATFLEQLISSDLVIPGYLDLTNLTGSQLKPFSAVTSFTGGSNGDSPVPSDYIGDSAAKTGLYAFDASSDMSQIAIPVIYDVDVNNALDNYVNSRGDLQGLLHLNPNLVGSANILTARLGLTTDKYSGIFGGGTIKRNPDTKALYGFSEIADVVNILNYVDKNFAPGASPANYVKGSVDDAVDVMQNFGGDGMYNDLNLLANNQINMMVAEGGKVYLSGNYSGLVGGGKSKAQWFNIIRLLVYIKKSLNPTLKKYLQEPAYIPTFLKLFREVEPFLDGLADKGSLYKGAGESKKGYDWKGDQDASSLDDLTINTQEDLDNGDYRAELDLYPVSAINKITMAISLNTIAGTASITFN